MTFQELREKLAAGRLVISTGLLTPNIDRMLGIFYGGGAIILEDAVEAGGETGQWVLAGRADFLNCTNLNTTLTSWVDEDGNAQLLVEYRLMEFGKPGTWKFSYSFPQLPLVDDGPYLDRLALEQFSCLVASCECRIADRKQTLLPGMNFFGKSRPCRLLGPLAALAKPGDLVEISGMFLPIDPAKATPPLKPLGYPWDMLADGCHCPGIYLQAALEHHLTLGSLKLDVDALQIYIPPTREWFEQNSDYFSFFTYIGSFSMKSLGIHAAIQADFDPDGGMVFLPMAFSGVTLDNLSALADLSGKCDLASGLPAELQGISLGQLELLSVALRLSVSRRSLKLLEATMTVGMPQLHWQVWPELFCVESVAATFCVTDPFGSSRLDFKIGGKLNVCGVLLDVGGGNIEGGILYAQLAQAIDLPLQKLLGKYLSPVAAPADLTVQELGFAVSPENSYQMVLRMANEPKPWKIDLGFQSLVIEDVFLYGMCDQENGVTGHAGGTLILGDVAKLSILYQIPGNMVLRSRFPSLHLCDLLSTLCNQSIDIPRGFDLHFVESSVLIEKMGFQYHLLLGTQLEGFGVLALEVRKSNGQWGMALGLDLAGRNASDLPALSTIAQFEQVFSLDHLLLVVSSFSDIEFSFPNMGRFEDPKIAGCKLVLPGNGVVAGLNFYGQWSIDTTDPKQGLLRSILGLNPQMGITLQVGCIPTQDLRLYVDYRTTIAGHHLVCRFGGQMQNGSVGLFLEGSMDVEIQGCNQTFEVALVFVTGGAYLAATNKSKKPIDFGIFQLGNMAIEVGFNWQGVPSFGIAGTISSGSFYSSIAVFFDSAQPTKSLVAGAVSDLSLWDIFSTFLGEDAQESVKEEPSDFSSVLHLFAVKGTQTFAIDSSLTEALDNLELEQIARAFGKHNIAIPDSIESVFLTVAQPGKIWFLTDLTNRMRHYQLKKVAGNGREEIQVAVEAQFYCAPQDTRIGSLAFRQGFYVNACLLFFGYQVMATVEIDSYKGFSFNAQMDKIVIGNENLFCVSAAQGSGGPVVSATTYGSPHLYINGKVSILGLETSVFLNANKNGLVFQLKKSFFSIIDLDVHGTIGSLDYLNIGGSVKAKIETIDLGPLGKVEINSGVTGKLDITANKGICSASLDAGFRFAGKNHKLPKIQLDVNTESLRNLPVMLWNKVKAFVTNLLSDAETWVYGVVEGAVVGVGNMVTILCEVFGFLQEEAKHLVLCVLESLQRVCVTTTAVQIL